MSRRLSPQVTELRQPRPANRAWSPQDLVEFIALTFWGNPFKVPGLVNSRVLVAFLRARLSQAVDSVFAPPPLPVFPCIPLCAVRQFNLLQNRIAYQTRGPNTACKRPWDILQMMLGTNAGASIGASSRGVYNTSIFPRGDFNAR